MNNMFQKKTSYGKPIAVHSQLFGRHFILQPTNQPTHIFSIPHLHGISGVPYGFVVALPTGEIKLPLPLKSFATCTKHGGNRHVAGLYLLATTLFDGWGKVSCVDFFVCD